MTRLLCIAALAGLTAAACAQSSSSGIPIGVTGSLYLPSSQTIRNAFSDGIVGFGVSPGGAGHAKEGIGAYFGFISAHERGNSLLIVPVTVGYERRLARRGAEAVPYARVSAGAAYYDYSIRTGGDLLDAKRLGSTGNLQLGVIFHRRLRLAVEYDVFSATDGLSFNGFQFSATYTLLRV